MCNKLGGRERAAICFVSPVEARIKRRERLIALFVDDCTALAHSTRKPGRRLPSRKSPRNSLIELQRATFSSPFWLNHRKPEVIGRDRIAGLPP